MMSILATKIEESFFPVKLSKYSIIISTIKHSRTYKQHNIKHHVLNEKIAKKLENIESFCNDKNASKKKHNGVKN